MHNALAGSPVAALMEATFGTSNVLGYWRFYRRGGPIDGAHDEEAEPTGQTTARTDVKVRPG